MAVPHKRWAMILLLTPSTEAILFLSKRNESYYPYYTGCGGRRKKVSTHATHKTDALKFLQSYQEFQIKIRSKIFGDFVGYVQDNYSPRSYRMYQVMLRHFAENAPPSIQLDSVTVCIKHKNMTSNNMFVFNTERAELTQEIIRRVIDEYSFIKKGDATMRGFFLRLQILGAQSG